MSYHPLLKSVFSMIGINFAISCVNIVKNICLARLIAPNYFGIMAMALIYVSITYRFAGVLAQRMALFHASQKEQPDQYEAHFFISLAMVLLSVPVVVGVAYVLEAESRPDIFWLSLVFLGFSCFELISMTALYRLEKRLDYQTICWIRIVSLFVGLVGTAYCVYYKLYLQALMVDRGLMIIVASTLYWLCGRWWPQRLCSWKTLRWYLSYGKGFWLMEVADAVKNEVIEFTVGRWAGVISLAFYRKGSTFARLPLVTLVNNAIGVVLPVYVKYRDDKRKTVFILSQFTRLTIGAMGLIYGVLFVVADPFVVLVLGEPWRTIIPFFRLFCILSFIKTFTHNISDYLSVSGLQRVSIKNEFFLLIWIVIFVSLLSFWLGIRGIVIGLICAYLPSIVYLYRQLKRYKDISLYGIALRGFLVFAASMWLSTWLIRKGESLVMGNWNQVILKAGIYGLVYGVLWIVVEGKQAYQVWAAWKGLNVVK